MASGLVEPADRSRPPRAVAPGSAGRRLFRLEDLLLVGWLVLVEPLLLPPSAAITRGPDLTQGLLGLVGMVGLGACLGARAAPGSGGGLTSRSEVAWAVGPLFGAFVFAGDETVRNLGVAAAGPILLLLVGGAAVGARLGLPPLTAPQRRGLVAPFVLATSGYFTGIVAGFREFFDLRELVPLLASEGSLGWFYLTMGVGAVLVFYVMLVFAPRQVAEREGTPLAWAARFGLYLASLALGTTWAGIVG